MTKVELLTAAARDLHVLGAGQALSASVEARLNERYLQLHAMLSKVPGSIQWAVGENIPARFELPVIQMLAALSVNVFGIGGDRKALLLAQGQLYADPISPAERMYRRMLVDPYVSTTLKTQDF